MRHGVLRASESGDKIMLLINSIQLLLINFDIKGTKYIALWQNISINESPAAGVRLHAKFMHQSG
jgi:hypothetical protein